MIILYPYTDIPSTIHSTNKSFLYPLREFSLWSVPNNSNNK